MLKFNRSKKRLVIPAGINPSYGIDSSTLYNVSDADIVASDVLEGKIGYGKDGKIVGTLDLESEKEESYQEGYEFGYNEGNNAGYQLGYDEGNSDGYNNGYTIGNTDGIATGRDEIITEQSDANITASDVLINKIGYSANNEKIVGTVDLNGEKEISYQDGYETGKSHGIEIGKDEIIDGMSDATITPQNLPSGLIGYGVNNTRVVGEANVVSSIDVAASGIKFGNSTFTEVPSYYDFSNCTDMSSMFSQCLRLTTVPQLNTSKVTNTSAMFAYCSSITSVPLFDTSRVTTMYQMFFNCGRMTTFPQFDTSSCDDFCEMFTYCDGLIEVPEFNWSSLSGTSYACTTIFGSSYSASTNIENIGGFKDAGKSYGNSGSYKDIVICYCPKLTYESCMNVINKVYDLNLNTQNTYTPKIRFHATPYSLLSADDIAIATAKGWTVQAG